MKALSSFLFGVLISGGRSRHRIVIWIDAFIWFSTSITNSRKKNKMQNILGLFCAKEREQEKHHFSTIKRKRRSFKILIKHELWGKVFVRFLLEIVNWIPFQLRILIPRLCLSRYNKIAWVACVIWPTHHVS